MPDVLVNCNNLNKIFHGSSNRAVRFFLNRPRLDVHAVKDINLKLQSGQVLGVMGPNGAGKTTLVKILCTLLSPTSGTADICGRNLSTNSNDIRKNIAFITGDERSFYWRLTGWQNIRFFGGLLGMSVLQIRNKVDTLAPELGLSDLLEKRFDTYSTGNRQKLAILRGLLGDAKVLFLDEPTRSLDPSSALALTRLLRDDIAHKQARAVFFVTHRLEEAQSTCDELLIMKSGGAVFQGAPSSFQDLGAHAGWRIQVRGSTKAALDKLDRLPSIQSSLYHTVTEAGKIKKNMQSDTKEVEFIDIEDTRPGGTSLDSILRVIMNAGVEILDVEKTRQAGGEIFRELTEGDEEDG